MYFPAKKRVENACEKGYQYTSSRGDGFSAYIDSDENVKVSEQKILEECNKYFDEEFKSIEECKNKIHDTLKKVNSKKNEVIILLQNIKDKLGNTTIEQYIIEINKKLKEYKKLEVLKKENNEENRRTVKKYKERIKEWENIFNNIPLIYIIFKQRRKIYKFMYRSE